MDDLYSIEYLSMINTVCHYDNLSSIKDEWDQIYYTNRVRSPYLSFDYLRLWYKYFANPSAVRVVQIKTNSRTIGFIPLVLLNWGPIRCLGSLANDHCFQGEPLVLDFCETEFVEEVVKFLVDARGSFDVLCQSYSYSFSKLYGLIPDEILTEKVLSFRRQANPTYVVNLNKSADIYLKEDLSSKLFREIRRCVKKLRSLGNVWLDCKCGGDAIKAWDTFVDLENSGWKGRSGTSIKKCGVEYRMFYEQWVRLLGESGVVKIYFLMLNDKAIAGGFGYSNGHIYEYSKMAYDEQYQQYSPGYNLFIEMIKDLGNNVPDIKLVHLYPWDYGYKHRLSNDVATYVNTRIYSPSIRGKLPQAYDWCRQRLKIAIRQV